MDRDAKTHELQALAQEISNYKDFGFSDELIAACVGLASPGEVRRVWLAAMLPPMAE